MVPSIYSLFAFCVRPYKGVIAERQIRRLKNQVKGERLKHISGRPRSSLDMSAGRAGERFESQDQLDEEEFQQSQCLAPHERRLCKVVGRAKSASAAGVDVVSTEKLLEASLQSLESLGRQMHVAGSNSISMGYGGGDDGDDVNLSLSRSQQGYARSPTSVSTAGAAGAQQNQPYPNDSYLRGAMWLGRNFTIISEELAEDMDAFRTKFTAEVAVATQDTDARRCCNRLSLLANSGVTQAHSMTNKARIKIRDILQVQHCIAYLTGKYFESRVYS